MSESLLLTDMGSVRHSVGKAAKRYGGMAVCHFLSPHQEFREKEGEFRNIGDDEKTAEEKKNEM